jgi:hypothetical protein
MVQVRLALCAVCGDDAAVLLRVSMCLTIKLPCTGHSKYIGKSPFTEGKKRYLELKDKPLPSPITSVPDPPLVHRPDKSVLWRLSDYEKILKRVHDSHDAAIAAGKAIATKHSATQAAAIDMTMPFSPDAATQSASPEPTPQPAAAATQPLSAIITLLSCLCPWIMCNSHPFVFESQNGCA